jgi:protoheme IX farnesyltransferase
MFKDYYALTKSSLVLGNIITVIGGFALAARGHFNILLLLATLVGIFLVMASGCVFNNYIDRDIDAKMERTKDRALVAERISGRNAIIFAAILGLLGFLTLIVYTNLLAFLVALLGFVFYVGMYSLWFKRRSAWGTIVGAVAGAVPPVVGYCAVHARIDAGTVILFLIMFFWQMPHFFAIAIRRADDYAAANIPVLPVKRGVWVTKIAMTLYIIAFIAIASLLTVFHYTGYGYLGIVLVLGLVWLGICIKGFSAKDVIADKLWAKKMFFFSLVVLMALFITITIGSFFP